MVLVVSSYVPSASITPYLEGKEIFNFLDLIFFHCWSRCPLAVAMDGLRYFLMFLRVRPRNVVRKLLFTADMSVDIRGLKSMPYLASCRDRKRLNC